MFAAIAVAKSSSKYWRDNLDEWRQAVIDALPEPDSTVLRRSPNGISSAVSSKRTGACGPGEKKDIVGVITTEVAGEEHTTFVYTCVTRDDETVGGAAGDIAYADVLGAVGGAIAGSLSPDPVSTVTVSGITAVSSSGEEATCEIAEEFDWECP